MRRRSGTVGIAFLLVAVAIGAAAAPDTVAAQPLDPAPFAVSQGGDCVEVTPLGNATETVESFYDYRSHGAEYSSHGTTHLQRSGASQLFFYRGSGGVSLVFLHDAMGDGAGGGTITMTVSALPEDREWAVEDDDYGSNTDDDFSHAATRSRIEWVWGPNRSDGAAISGFDGLDGNVTVDPAFNDESARWDEWRYTGDGHRIERWFVRSGTGETHELNTSAPLRIRAGDCSDVESMPGTSAAMRTEQARETATQTATWTPTATLFSSRSTSTTTTAETVVGPLEEMAVSDRAAASEPTGPTTGTDAGDTPDDAGDTPDDAGTMATTSPIEYLAGPGIGVAIGTLLVIGSAALRERR